MLVSLLQLISAVTFDCCTHIDSLVFILPVISFIQPVRRSLHTKPTITSDLNTPCEEEIDASDEYNSLGDTDEGGGGEQRGREGIGLTFGIARFPKTCPSYDSHNTDTLTEKLNCLNLTSSTPPDPSLLPPHPAPRAALEEEWIFPQSPGEKESDVREPRTGYGPGILPPTCARYDILVVDDSTLNRKMLKRVFNSSGYTYDEAVDGVTAVEKVRSRMTGESGRSQYDAILMDFVMPNMDGPSATEIIRALGYKGIIFGVTGKSQENDIAYFMSKGADGVLTKPFDPAVFLQLMQKMHANAQDSYC